jgi:hypothetical protein
MFLRKKLVALLLCCISTIAHGQEDVPVNSGDYRAASHLTLSYAPVTPGLFVPLKHGPQLAYIVNRNWTVEGDYQSGNFGFNFAGVNFASFRETLWVMRGRWYPDTNSFHFFGGIGRRDYRLSIGTEWAKEHLPSPNADLLRVRQPVLEIGLGNRWQWRHGFTVGVDWASVYWPILANKTEAPMLDGLSDGATKRSIERALSRLTKVPSFSVAKVSLGWTF